MYSTVAEIVEQVVDVARNRRPDDALLHRFLGRYYRELPDDDADAERVDEAYAGAVTHLSVGRRRQDGETLVRVLSPTLERDGWTSDRSVLMFVTDDVPFLVDTVRLVLDRHGRGIHLLVHPRLRVERDADGTIVAVDEPEKAPVPDGHEVLAEAWTMIEIDRCDSDAARAIERDVSTALADVHQIVADFHPMRARLLEVGGDDPLVRWLADPHLVFLGAATYDRSVADDGTVTLTYRPGTGLGELREDGGIDPTVIDPPPHPDSAAPLTFARAERESMVHRGARLQCVSLRPTPDVEHRFIGLLGSGAYRNSVFSIPTVGDRAAEVLVLADPSEVSHTGRAVKHVIDTLPRDLVFEIDREALAELVIDIVGLHERRIVRVFDVAEPVGPWTTVLAYLPRVRFDAALPGVVERLVADYYGGEVRDVTTFLGSSSLVRISMSVRAEERGNLDELAATLDRATRSWGERAADALCRKLGDVEGRRVWAALSDGIPANFEAATVPETSVPDLLKVAVLAGVTTSPAALESSRGEGHIRTSIGRDLDGERGYWRFKVAHSGPQSRLADLVPLLNHLGLSALEQHPYDFVVPGDGERRHVHLYDLGVIVEHDEPSPERLDEVQATFAGLLVGDIEADSLNALVLGAGLDRRQVAVLRCYSRYLQQVGFAYGQDLIAAALRRQPALAAALADLFDVRFGIRRGGRGDEADAAAKEHVEAMLDEIPSLDDDRICRAVLTLIDATLRTNAFRHGTTGTFAEVIAVKLNPQGFRSFPNRGRCSRSSSARRGRGSPPPRRTGRARRVRWSDRPEDFRTEVLGLVKAQMVKNAVIVPEGAKGGFVVKRPGCRRPIATRSVPRASTATADSSVRCSTSPTTSTVPRSCVPARHVSSTTATTPTSSSPPTRARRRSATSPTSSRSTPASGSATRSRREAATATTTRRWGSPRVAPGRACAVTPG
jgi:glutamate dehydrogenase